MMMMRDVFSVIIVIVKFLLLLLLAVVVPSLLPRGGGGGGDVGLSVEREQVLLLHVVVVVQFYVRHRWWFGPRRGRGGETSRCGATELSWRRIKKQKEKKNTAIIKKFKYRAELGTRMGKEKNTLSLALSSSNGSLFFFLLWEGKAFSVRCVRTDWKWLGLFLFREGVRAETAPPYPTETST